MPGQAPLLIPASDGEMLVRGWMGGYPRRCVGRQAILYSLHQRQHMPLPSPNAEPLSCSAPSPGCASSARRAYVRHVLTRRRRAQVAGAEVQQGGGARRRDCHGLAQGAAAEHDAEPLLHDRPRRQPVLRAPHRRLCLRFAPGHKQTCVSTSTGQQVADLWSVMAIWPACRTRFVPCDLLRTCGSLTGYLYLFRNAVLHDIGGQMMGWHACLV